MWNTGDTLAGCMVVTRVANEAVENPKTHSHR